MLRVFWISCIAACILGVCIGDTAAPNVHTVGGTYIGTSETLTIKDRSVRINKFLGIPYAEPPIGYRRFKKTELLGKLEKPHAADRIGPACRQIAVPGMSSPRLQSEDCLFLNVYVPHQPSDQEGGHAVMVFIHGGAFISGTGEIYHGERLSGFGNVIVITINYRLGVFGFFGTGDEEAPGNLGFWDQRVALQWVQNNIGGFGGNKSRVTIFGESAGGTSVLYHALFPENEGLFQRIISQSGAPNANIALNRDPEVTFRFVAEHVNCKTDVVKDMVECLQGKDTELIMDTLNELMKSPENIPYLRFYPLIDGEFIRIHPGTISRLSKTTETDQVNFFRSIDSIIGCNSQEGAMFVSIPFAVPIEDPEHFLPTREEFETQMIPILLAMEFDPDTPYLVKSMLTSQYTNWADPDSPESVRQQFLDMWGDFLFNVATIEMSEVHAISTHARTASSYLYHMEATPSTPLLRRLDWLKGANHADELAYMFGFLADIMAANQTYRPPQDWEYELSYTMMAYWSNFAKTGDPNTPQHADVRLPEWPAYDVIARRHVVLDQQISVGHDLYAERVDFWLNVLPSVLNALKDKQNASNSDGYCTADGDCGGP